MPRCGDHIACRASCRGASVETMQKLEPLDLVRLKVYYAHAFTPLVPAQSVWASNEVLEQRLNIIHSTLEHSAHG